MCLDSFQLKILTVGPHISRISYCVQTCLVSKQNQFPQCQANFKANNNLCQVEYNLEPIVQQRHGQTWGRKQGQENHNGLILHYYPSCQK